MRLSPLEIARICHEANRAYCSILGDNSQLPWHEAPAWQHKSCVAGVNAILTDPRTTPEESHQNWLIHKAQEGWVYGPVKDPEKRTHPCIVPYSQLPAEQRRKDEIFRAIVLACLHDQIVHDQIPLNETADTGRPSAEMPDAHAAATGG